MNEILSVLESERARLQRELDKVEQAIRLFREDRSNNKPAKPRGRGKGRVKGKMSIGDAIITALANGKLKVPEIVEKVCEVKKVSKGSINATLAVLKKKGAIKSVERGVYSLKKG